MQEEYFMKIALEQAEHALADGEFPVGCVIASSGGVLSSGCRTGTSGAAPNEIEHAEITALKHLEERHKELDKKDLTLFCTMEPCLMCFGAILLSGIRKIVYSYEDVMGGGTSCDLSLLPPLYRECKVSIVSNVLREQSLKLFKAYFENPANVYWKGSLLARYTLEQ
ncbi:MAG: nucleoside deaminase [Deltaproteobacteria bacterium]|nr:nucleoside deaminase [Deltaproteobacteria bacterium]